MATKVALECINKYSWSLYQTIFGATKHLDFCPAFRQCDTREGLRSSANANSRYVVPATRSKLGERAFSVAGPTAWNSLPDDIRQTIDTAAFKRQLKTHYFNLAFIK